MTETNSIRDEASVRGSEITLLAVASALVRWRRRILILALAGGLAGVSISLLSTRMFESSVTFIPQTSNSQESGLAIAASQFGLRLPPSGGTWGAPLYVELLSSRTLLEPIAKDTFVVTEEGGRRIALADLLKVDIPASPRRIEATIRALQQNVVGAAQDIKTGSVQLSVTTHWPSISFALAQRLVSGVNDFNLQTRKSQAKAEREFIESQIQETDAILRQEEDSMQLFLQKNRVIGSPGLVFEQDRLRIEIARLQSVLSSLKQNLVDAKIREVRDTPVITIIEAPTLPVTGLSRKSAQKGLLGAILGVLLALSYSAAAMVTRSTEASAQEFRRVLNDARPGFLRRRPRVPAEGALDDANRW